VRRARVRGLVRGATADWHVESDGLALLIKELPRQSVWTLEELYGVGELLARGPDRPRAELTHFVRNRAAVPRLWRECTSVIAEELGREPGLFKKDGVDRLLRPDTVDHELRTMAEGLLAHRRYRSHQLYGVGALIDALLPLHPVAFGRWLRGARRYELKECAISHLTDRLIFGNAERQFTRQLLRTKVAGLQALAVCALVGELPTGDNSIEVDDLINLLRLCAVPESTAWSLALQVLRARVLERRRRSDRIDGDGSTAAVQLLRSADDAVERSLRQLCAALPGELDRATASDQLLAVFGIDTPQLAVRAALHLGSDPLSELLVDAVIAHMGNELGLRRGASPEERASLSYDSFARWCEWWVKAVELKHVNDAVGVGRRVGQLLAPLSILGDRVLHAPHAAVRWPSAYADVLKRRAASVLVALEAVASATSAAEASHREPLLQLALNEAEKILRADRLDVDTGHTVHQLAVLSTTVMWAGSTATDRRRSWGQDTKLPAFVRSLALWSTPELVLADSSLALSVFGDITASVTSGVIRMRVWQQVATLADIAVSRAAQAGALDGLAPLLSQVWRQAATDLELPRGPWQQLDSILVGAVRGRGSDRQTLLGMAGWQQSNCMQLVA
jgi:hypothetical protein